MLEKPTIKEHRKTLLHGMTAFVDIRPWHALASGDVSLQSCSCGGRVKIVKAG